MSSDLDTPATARQAGYIIGSAIGHMPLATMMQAYQDEALEAAGITRDSLHARYLVLLFAAALHSVESSGLSPEHENDVAQGLFDWAREQPPAQSTALLQDAEQASETFAQAAADDLEETVAFASYSQLELEFFDQLIALGEKSEARARACIQLAAVLPSELWHVQVASTLQGLERANLVPPR